jgi:hypothetical protein
MNNWHPNIKFTVNSSPTSIDFLDITIYKGPSLLHQHLLDVKTFQKKIIYISIFIFHHNTQRIYLNLLSLENAYDTPEQTPK